jgi:hypothetical protein
MQAGHLPSLFFFCYYWTQSSSENSQLEESMDKGLANRVEYVISLAKQVPFYVKKAEEGGVELDRIRTPDDLCEAYKKGFYTTSSDLPELALPLARRESQKKSA